MLSKWKNTLDSRETEIFKLQVCVLFHVLFSHVEVRFFLVFFFSFFTTQELTLQELLAERRRLEETERNFQKSQGKLLTSSSDLSSFDVNIPSLFSRTAPMVAPPTFEDDDLDTYKEDDLFVTDYITGATKRMGDSDSDSDHEKQNLTAHNSYNDNSYKSKHNHNNGMFTNELELLLQEKRKADERQGTLSSGSHSSRHAEHIDSNNNNSTKQNENSSLSNSGRTKQQILQQLNQKKKQQQPHNRATPAHHAPFLSPSSITPTSSSPATPNKSVTQLMLRRKKT